MLVSANKGCAHTGKLVGASCMLDLGVGVGEEERGQCADQRAGEDEGNSGGQKRGEGQRWWPRLVKRNGVGLHLQ